MAFNEAVSHNLASITFKIAVGKGNINLNDTLYVNSSNGRVGIGTDSPASRLHVVPATAGDGIVIEAIKIHPKVIWMQLGIINEEAAKIAENNGIEVVMDRCLKIEYKRLIKR